MLKLAAVVDRAVAAIRTTAIASGVVRVAAADASTSEPACCRPAPAVTTLFRLSRSNTTTPPPRPEPSNSLAGNALAIYALESAGSGTTARRRQVERLHAQPARSVA